MFLHLLAAQQIWLARITGEETDELELWPEPNLKRAADLINGSHFRLKALTEQLMEEGDRIISSGKAFESNLSDILYHLIIHGQHHRAQIVADAAE